MSYPSSVSGRDVIIGGGVHAAVFAATRRALGKSQPIVIERTSRTGGIFSRLVAFRMNSICGASLESAQKGPSRIPSRDTADDLNYLPNAPYQHDSRYPGCEYPLSTAFASIVADTLEATAEVYVDAVVKITDSAEVYIGAGGDEGEYLGTANRILWAGGLSQPAREDYGNAVITAEDFLTNPYRLAIPDRVAIVGGGDTAATVAEMLLGQGATTIDYRPSRIDWYGGSFTMPTTKKEWAMQYHARYMGIARHFPEKGVTGGMRTGVIRPIPLRGEIVPLGDTASVNSDDIYRLVIDATGFKPVKPNVSANLVYGNSLARWNGTNIIRIGTSAEITGNTRGSQFSAAGAAIFALSPRTASLAGSLS